MFTKRDNKSPSFDEDPTNPANNSKPLTTDYFTYNEMLLYNQFL